MTAHVYVCDASPGLTALTRSTDATPPAATPPALLCSTLLTWIFTSELTESGASANYTHHKPGIE